MSSLSSAEKIRFIEVCNVLERITKSKNLSEKENIMRQFITGFHARKTHRDDSFHPFLRLLLPQLDRERVYGLKHHSLGKLYLKILCLSEQSKDGQKLKNYNESASGACNDFADVMFWILKSRYSEEIKSETLSVREVNSHLDNIAVKNANNDRNGVETELEAMIRQMSPTEQKWLIRMLLKDLRISVSQKKVLAMFHPDANDQFDVSNNLQKVCSKLVDPSVRLNEIGIEIFQAFKPMLSQQCDVEAVNKNIKGADAYYVEIKFDGERFQVHMKDDEFKYFSRNGYEYTDNYGCNASNGVLTPKLAKQLSPRVRSCILDGEMMCWNTRKKSYTTKGMDIDVKWLKIGHVNQPCFVVFDILYFNGQILTNKPLMDRFKILEEIIQPLEGVIVVSKKDVVDSGEKILHVLKLAIENCEEGIIVKNPNSVYKFNARNAGWYKIKPEYTDGLMQELDLLIIGGYYGGGRRQGVISTFLLGIADPKKNENGEPTKFYSLARVGSGYSDLELEELNGKLEKFWKKIRGSEKPTNIEWTREKPDVWIKPSDSIILQVKATEVVPCDLFPVDYTLRFPRVQKIRYDKPWYDCMDVDLFSTLRQAFSGKLTSNYTAKLNDDSSSKGRKLKRNIKKPCLEESSSSKKIRKEEIVSQLFQNKEMCVLPSATFSKPDVEMKIMRHGGTVVQHPSKDTFCVIANENNVRVTNIARLETYDIVKSTWLDDCIDKNKLRKWRPDDLLVMSANTSGLFSEEYDDFGDSFTEKIDEDRFEQLINSVKIDVKASIFKDMIELDKGLFGKNNPCAIFRGCIAYFHDVYESIDREDEAPILKSMFRFHGGIVASEINRNTTHIITSSGAKLSDEIRRRDLPNNVCTIDSKWITESWDAKHLLDVSSYLAKF